MSSKDALFHYTRRSTAIESILLNNSFRFSLFKNSNDPHEYKKRLISTIGWGLEDTELGKLGKVQAIIERLIIDHTYYLSFCLNSYDNGIIESQGYSKSRMWSQYGDNHEGICFVFSRSKITELFKKKFVNDNYLLIQGNVDYESNVNIGKRHKSIPIDSKTLKTYSPTKIVLKHAEQYCDEIFFRKNVDYKDEQEYRFVIVHQNTDTIPPSQIYFKLNECLIGIVLGDKFPKVYRSTIEMLCKNINIPYKKLNWDYGQYELLNSL